MDPINTSIFIGTYNWVRSSFEQKSIVENITSKQNSSLKPLDVRVFRGAEYGSDHFCVKGKLYFIQRIKKGSFYVEEDGEITNITEPTNNTDSLKDKENIFHKKKEQPKECQI